MCCSCSEKLRHLIFTCRRKEMRSKSVVVQQDPHAPKMRFAFGDHTMETLHVEPEKSEVLFEHWFPVCFWEIDQADIVGIYFWERVNQWNFDGNLKRKSLKLILTCNGYIYTMECQCFCQILLWFIGNEIAVTLEIWRHRSRYSCFLLLKSVTIT